jgi:hypothetical protein
MTGFMGDNVDSHSRIRGESEYGGDEILTLTDQAADRGKNQGRICCQMSQPSKSGGTQGTFGYKKQD